MFSTLLHNLRNAWRRVWSCSLIKTPEQFEECITVRTVDPPHLCVSMIDTSFDETMEYLDKQDYRQKRNMTIFTDKRTVDGWHAELTQRGVLVQTEEDTTSTRLQGVEVMIVNRDFLLSLHPTADRNPITDEQLTLPLQ